ncbi:MAG: glycosyl transferase group 1 [Sphingobacteriales bacterium]|nr:glycosyl transferase group 1 [Sphingobacteriales bacterium]
MESSMIYINGKYLTQRLTGVQRYAYELTNCLVKNEKNVRVLVPEFLDISAIDLPAESIIKTGKSTNTTLWEQFDLPRFLGENNNNLLINLCNTGPIFNKNQFVCIHDMSYMENPKWFSKSFYYYYKFMIPKVARISTHVLTVSEFSKSELQSKLGLNHNKVSVIYNAPAKTFVSSTYKKINLKKENFFLFVGSLDPRKNLKTLLEVFANPMLKKQKLVIVGAKQNTLNDENLLLPLNVELLDNCSDVQLKELYSKAKALINCSLYEGFGLPVVEAMSSGCPLLLSDIAVFNEIAGEHAMFFNPNDPSNIINTINTFLERSEKEINVSIKANYYYCAKYSWEKSSKDLLKIVRRESWV